MGGEASSTGPRGHRIRLGYAAWRRKRRDDVGRADQSEGTRDWMVKTTRVCAARDLCLDPLRYLIQLHGEVFNIRRGSVASELRVSNFELACNKISGHREELDHGRNSVSHAVSDLHLPNAHG